MRQTSLHFRLTEVPLVFEYPLVGQTTVPKDGVSKGGNAFTGGSLAAKKSRSCLDDQNCHNYCGENYLPKEPFMQVIHQTHLKHHTCK